MRHERQIGTNLIIVNALDEQAPMVEDLLDTLAQLDAKGPALHEGMHIGYGRITLLAEMRGL